MTERVAKRSAQHRTGKRRRSRAAGAAAPAGFNPREPERALALLIEYWLKVGRLPGAIPARGRRAMLEPLYDTERRRVVCLMVYALTGREVRIDRIRGRWLVATN